MWRTFFSRLLLLATLIAARSASAQGPFVGVDLGASEPTDPNYRGHVQTGVTGNPYVGYMFNQYLGLQGQVHVTYQNPDDNPGGRAIKNELQSTTLLGATVGPRLSIPIGKLLELYGTAQGGGFTGLSGRVSHSAGFSVGPGINVNLSPTVAVGLFARWNRAYMAPRPEDLGLDQVPDQRRGKDIQWATAGIGVKFSFPRAAAPAPPPPPPQVAEAPPPAPKTERVIVLRAVYFDFDKYSIRPDAAPVLDEAAQIIKDEHLSVVAEGHTDGIGTVKYNLGLSRRRASSVRDYLIAHGIAPDRIETEGYGKSRPIASNDTVEGRAQNRRVELHAK